MPIIPREPRAALASPSSARWRLAALLLVLATSACDYALHWRATVRDPSGAPVAGARVTVSCRIDRATTDADGTFSLDVLGGIPHNCSIDIATPDRTAVGHTTIDPYCTEWHRSGCIKARDAVITVTAPPPP